MKASVLFIIFLFVTALGHSQLGTMSIVQLPPHPHMSGVSDIYFDLNGGESAYDIEAKSSLDDVTAYYPGPMEDLADDACMVGPGSGLHVERDAISSSENHHNTQSSLQIRVIVNNGKGSQPGDGVTDIDGNIYPSVIIGQQEWMAENLRVTRDSDGNPISRHCHDDDLDWCDLYGGLYTWHTVMNGQGSSSGNPSGVQGICPTGWHVPSDAEWIELINHIVSQGFPNENVTNGAGNALKSCRQIGSPFAGCDTSEHPRWIGPAAWADDHYGFDHFSFSALPGGIRSSAGNYANFGIAGNWWSATEGSSGNAFYHALGNNQGNAVRNDLSKTNGYSLRCVRDASEEPATYQLHLEADPANAGSLTGAGEYHEGAEVSINAMANEGWEFANWTGDIDYLDDADSKEAVVTMPAGDVSLLANFILAAMPENLHLTEVMITSGENECFDALEQIILAGDGGWFHVQEGGSTELIAGQSIHVLPGTVVNQGGYLLARIAQHADDYCGIPKTFEITEEPVTREEEDIVSTDFPHEIRENGFFKLYPNPTDGSFTLELTTAEIDQTIIVEVHSVLGGRLSSRKLPSQRIHTLSIEGHQSGMYIIRVMKGDKVGVERLIKR